MNPRIPRCAFRALVLALAAAGSAAGHEGHDMGGSVVAAGAQVQKLAGGFAFTEGPACDARGNLYFSDIPNLRIHRWSTDGELITVREETGRANGLYFDRNGHLLVCEGGARRVIALSPAGEVTVLADRYGGKPLNSPNDLWVDPKGGVYFSDPRYGDGSGATQDGNHVYYLAPDRGALVRVVDDMVEPNGVLGTPDGKTLFVADIADGRTLRFPIRPDGTLGKAELFAAQSSDGLTRDEEGNVYLTGPDGVSIYDSGGEKHATIPIPEKPSNAVFCGPNRKTLFVTARTGLYSLRMNVEGQ